MAASDPSPDATDAGPATTEALLVALAILALIVAAFALPPFSPGAAAGPDNESGPNTPVETAPPPTSTPSGGTDSGTPTDEEVRVIDDGNSSGGSDARVTNRSVTEPHPDCFVVVWDRLVPGDGATILIWNDESYVGSQTVWFENRSIGTTGLAGLVQGRVPYQREIDITAEVPPVEECHFLHLEKRQGYDAYVSEHGERPTIVVGDPGEGQTPTDGTVSESYPVRGQPNLTVIGEPYPEEPVEIHASVAGVPMRDATVSVDGSRVGATDANGNATIQVPGGGQDAFEVSVERGDFRASERVEILLLTVAIEPQQVLAVPGGEATVVARVAERPAEDVTVSIAGERLGTTNADGTVTMTLPAKLGATVTAAGAHGQTAGAAVWPHYLVTALVVVFAVGVVVFSLLGVARTESGPSWRRVAAGWIAVGAFVAAWIGWGPRGAAAVLGVLALAGIAIVAVRRREAIEQWVGRARSGVRNAGTWIRAMALRTATVLARLTERIPDGFRGLLALLRTAFEAAIARVRVVGGWLRTRPRRVPAAIARLLSRFRRALGILRREYLSRWVLVALLGAALVILGAAWYADAEGAIGATVALGVLGLLAWWRLSGEDTSTETGEVSIGHGAPSVSGASRTAAERKRSLRELWRTFARWVVPGHWRTRTPGEIARSAVDRGFPESPVRQLTAVFREVEYGNRSLSDDRLERAREAFQALRDRDDEEAAD